MSRSASQASLAPTSTTTSTSTNSKSLAFKPPNTTASTSSSNPIPVDNVKLFVTNLRLLDLDQRDDWPDITVQTFSTKNAEQNQKKRIAAVEWALFRLFEIWDPADTREKLQAFFPPLEPLQSLNLRAALYRSLNELKKNGVLGRESVLRKSMLDECKGDKFYEVLVLFSTAVLKKTMAPKTTMTPRKKPKRRDAVAKELGMATKLSTGQQASLLPLAIAHKAALVNLLRRKEEKRRKYIEFSELLDKKSEEIMQRNQQCKAKGLSRRSMVSDIHANAIEKQLRENWIGNTKWLDTMLYGDTDQTDDRFLNSSFPEVWQVVESGGRLEKAGVEPGLLENLEKRVDEQNERLKKWKSFHEKIIKDKPRTSSQPTKASPPVTLDFKFDDHLKLQLGSAKPTEEKDGIPTKLLNPEYQHIIEEMKYELEEVAKTNHSRVKIPLMTKLGSSFSAPRSPVHPRSMASARPPKKSPDQAVEKEVQWPPTTRKRSKEDVLPVPVLRPTPMSLDSEATLVGQPTSLRPSSEHSNGSPVVESRRNSVPETSTPLPTLTSSVASAQSPISHHSRSSSTPHYPSEPPIIPAVAANTPSRPQVSIFDPSVQFLSKEDQLAENIIASIGAATPSPVKKQPRLSLLERTRMSMANTSTFLPIAESDSPPGLDLLPSLPATVIQPTAKPDRRISLADRTRMSMAHITAFKPIAEPESPPDLDPLPLLPPTVVQHAEKLDRRASLLDRTRLSMAAMAANPRPLPKKTKSKRESIFPVNQFETPRGRKSSRIDVLKDDALPEEELFSEDVDYDTVFKSRPRIAQSPKPQETDMEREEEEFDEGVTGVDLRDVDADEDEGFTEVWDSSPLRRVGGGLGRQSVVGRW